MYQHLREIHKCFSPREKSSDMWNDSAKIEMIQSMYVYTGSQSNLVEGGWGMYPAHSPPNWIESQPKVCYSPIQNSLRSILLLRGDMSKRSYSLWANLFTNIGMILIKSAAVVLILSFTLSENRDLGDICACTCNRSRSMIKNPRNFAFFFASLRAWALHVYRFSAYWLR